MKPAGKVHLVGAGPGDPELLTLKALKRIQQCDWILYDRLVSEAIRALIPTHVKHQFVGKQAGRPSMSQEAICDRLIELARAGHNVCRLKGGDPFLFGRGGEEMLALRAEQIDVEVVPAITAALGCGAAAGIPLTHRDVSQGISLLTAQGASSLTHNWRALTQLNHTLVFYMGVEQAAAIQYELINAGMSPEMPVAVIEKGTLPGQRTLITELAGLGNLVRAQKVKSPGLIIIGEVASLASETQFDINQFMMEALAA